MAKRSKLQFFNDQLDGSQPQQITDKSVEQSSISIVDGEIVDTDTAPSKVSEVRHQEATTMQVQDSNQEKSSYKDKVLNRPRRNFKEHRELRTERLSLALTKPTYDKLKLVASARKVSLNAICEKLVIDFLESL